MIRAVRNQSSAPRQKRSGVAPRNSPSHIQSVERGRKRTVIYDFRRIEVVNMSRIIRALSPTLVIATLTIAVAVHEPLRAQEARSAASSNSPQAARQPYAPPRPRAPAPPGYIRLPMTVHTGLAPKMRVQELPTGDSRTFEIHFRTGDEIVSGLTEFAQQHHIVSAYITGIGGLISAKLGWGSPSGGLMKEIDVKSKCELVSLAGNISEVRGHPYVHLHAVVAFSDGSTKGGHVIEAHVDPIAEIYVVTTGAPLSGPTPRALPR